MKESRYFKIIYYLLEKGQATAPELAHQLEVSVRTVYRDIDVISSTGIPIFMTTGRNGGIKLYEDFVLSKTLLSEQDRQEVLIGLQSLEATQYPDLHQTIHKFNALFKQSATDWIEVDFSIWGKDTHKESLKFNLLKSAILEQREIVFNYYATHGTCSTRRCHPIKLIYKDKSWYLYGFCWLSHEERLFKVSRIQNLNLTDTIFHTTYDRHKVVFPLPQNLGVMNEIELYFPLDMAHKVFDVFDETVITQENHKFHLKVKMPVNEWLYTFILSFGHQVEIIQPSWLKEEIIKRCERMLSHYKEEK